MRTLHMERRYFSQAPKARVLLRQTIDDNQVVRFFGRHGATPTQKSFSTFIVKRVFLTPIAFGRCSPLSFSAIVNSTFQSVFISKESAIQRSLVIGF
jgi:hypothetical protein